MGKASDVVKQYQQKIQNTNSTKKLQKLAKDIPTKFNKLKSSAENDPKYQALSAIKDPLTSLISGGAPSSNPDAIVSFLQKVLNILPGVKKLVDSSYLDKVEDIQAYQKAATELPTEINKKLEVLNSLKK